MADGTDNKVNQFSKAISFEKAFSEKFEAKGDKSRVQMFPEIGDIIAKTLPRKRQALLDKLYEDFSSHVKTESGQDFHDAELVSFVESLLLLLFSSMDNLRICQKVKKLLFAIAASTNTALVKATINQYIEGILSSFDGSPMVTAEKVCYILDELELGRSCIEDKLERVLQFLAYCFTQSAIQRKADGAFTTVNSHEELLNVSIKVFIKLMQHFSNGILGMVFCEACSGSFSPTKITVSCPHKVLEEVLSYVLEMLFTEEVKSKEICQLGGLAIGLFINTVAMENFPVLHIIETILHLDNTVEGLKTDTHSGTDNLNILELGTLRLNVSKLPLSPISQIAVVQGLVKCGSRILLMSRCSVSVGDEQVSLVEGPLFDVLYYHCNHTGNPVVQYVAFQALKQWLQCIKQMLTDLIKCEKDHVVLVGDANPLTHKLLCLVWDNHEHPVEGVPELVKSVFQLILEVHHSETSARGIQENQFYEHQAEKILLLPWHVKGRYSLFSSLIPFLNHDKLLKMNPSLPEELGRSLASNQLASASTDCYQAFLFVGKTKVTGKDENSLKEEWMQVLVEVLCSKDRLQRLNAVQYWLPCTLKHIPDVYKSLLNRLDQRKNTETDQGWWSLHAKLATVRTARMKQIVCTNQLEKYSALLSEGIFHSQDEVRSAALGVISCCPRTAEGLSDLEFRLLRQYLPHNMNIASPLFRQEMFASLKRIMARVRDSSLSVMKQCGLTEGNKKITKKINKDHLTEDLKKALEFTGWLCKFAAENLFPGACYQRQKSGVHLFSILLETMTTCSTQARRRKGHPPETSQFLVALARDCGFWDMFSQRNVMVLRACIESAHNDVREMARNLLEKHFPWPVAIVNHSDNLCADYLMRRTVRLLSSPKFPETESGAAMCHMIFTKYVLELGWKIDLVWPRDSSSEVKRDMESSQIKTDEPGLPFLQQLVQEFKWHASCARSNLVVASSKTPIHGLLLGLTRCFAVVLDRINSSNHGFSSGFVSSFRTLFKDLLLEANSIVQFMLEVLSGGNESGQKTVGGASFADMGEAIDELVLEAVPLTATESLPSNNQKELVLSCCWLTIKGAYTLLGTAVEKATYQEQLDDSNEDYGLISLNELQDIGQSFMAALIHCRHRGIVEGCKPSFIRVCKRLLSSPQPSVRELPQTWLDGVLTAVSSDNTRTSITRRSAGLPLLVACILGCEPHSVPDRPLLSYCMEIVFTAASKPLKDGIDQTSDLPQVHAMNILKLLYQDAPLGTHILQYCGDGLILAITGFSSRSWAIRNASTQLFGSVVARLFGHKIGSDSEEENKTISVPDLFNHYPALEEFFLHQLQVDAQCKDEMDKKTIIPGSLLKPELFPVLTVFSKLRPSSSDLPERLPSSFIPLIAAQASSSVFSVRVVAAKALVPFVTIDCLVTKAVELLKTLPVSQQLYSHNLLHGTLCQVKALLTAANFFSSVGSSETLKEELRNRIWIATHINLCPLIRAQFLNIVMEFASSLICDSSVRSEIRFLVSCIVAPQSPSALVGHPLLSRELSRACLTLTANNDVLQGEERWKEHSSIISSLLSSMDPECRLVALNGVISTIRSKQYDIVTQSLSRQLIDMVHTENDHSCLLTLLDILSELDIHFLGEFPLENIYTLWTKLMSLACGECGIPVAALALPPCSKLLSYCLKLMEGDGIDCECLCTLLQQWCSIVGKQSKPECDEQQRLSAVQALKIVGISVLQFAVNLQKEKSEIGDVAAQVSQTVVLAAVQLLEDENEKVRCCAAELASQIRGVQPVGIASESMNCASSLNALLEFVAHTLWRRPEIWVAMKTLIRDWTDLPTALDEYINARCLLYEQDTNQYAEPVVVARITGRMFKAITTKIFSVKTENDEVCKEYLEWLLLAFKELIGDLQVIVDSGLRDLGSFQSPKPFTLVFRLVCMADVLAHAYTVTILHPFKHTRELIKSYHEMHDLIKKIVHQLKESIDVCHPILQDVIQGVTGSECSSSSQHIVTGDRLSKQLQDLDFS